MALIGSWHLIPTSPEHAEDGLCLDQLEDTCRCQTPLLSGQSVGVAGDGLLGPRPKAETPGVEQDAEGSSGACWPIPEGGPAASF